MESEYPAALPVAQREIVANTPVLALETYLYETRQIDPLAVRQARLVCRPIADEVRHTEAHCIVLLVLAALRKGIPRADREVLLGPLSPLTIAEAATQLRKERGSEASWSAAIAVVVPAVSEAVEKLLADPQRYAPVTGHPPLDNINGWPLLVVAAPSIGFSRYFAALRRLENLLLPARLHEELDNPDSGTVAAALKKIYIDQSILPVNGRFHFRQLAAAALACRSRFLIISGGPGTGKTSVVIQLLRALLSVFPATRADQIVVCAPTGRAKARIGESLDAGIEAFSRRFGKGDGTPAALRSIERKTLHGLLGMRPDGTFKYTAASRLPCQVVVVDEASMVDLHLFAALLEALPESCRLILVGDMHQLPSVEAGALLGDLTERFSTTNGATLSPNICQWIRDTTADIDVDGTTDDAPLVCATPEAGKNAGALLNRTIILTRSYRTRGTGLSDLAHAINCGDSATAFGVLSTNPAAALIDERAGVSPVEAWLDTHLDSELFRQIGAFDGTITGKVTFPPEHTRLLQQILSASTILTLSHEGRRGRIAINALATTLLRSRLKIDSGQRFFHGLPVVVTANHHDLDLYNGDLGLIIRSSDDGVKAVFPRRTGCIITAVDRLSDLEIAFALTVHKAQGSEFDNVMLVLPEYASALLSRQIIYTGITRAKQSVTILGTRTILEKAISSREERPGGVQVG